jgi:hypothetical protein
MIRKLLPAVPAAPRGVHKLLGAALVAAAAAAAPAHASVITFEGALAQEDLFGGVAGGSLWQEAGFDAYLFANVPGDGAGSLVGMFFDNDVASCDSSTMACPVNNTGTYYGALNDGLIDLTRRDGHWFSLKSFDASFIGGSANLSSYPSVSGLLRVQGWTSTGASAYQDFLLDGPTAGGFTFGHYNVPTAFANMHFVEAAVFGFTCNTSGNCNAFTTNRGQFAIDNIDTNVPEPGTAAMVGLGLMGLLGALRRRQS